MMHSENRFFLVTVGQRIYDEPANWFGKNLTMTILAHKKRNKWKWKV